MDIVDMLKKAIQSRLEVEFVYDDLPRVFHPYLLYRAKDQSILCCGMQVGGQTSRNDEFPRFSNFHIQKMDSFCVNEIAFKDVDKTFKPDKYQNYDVIEMVESR